MKRILAPKVKGVLSKDARLGSPHLLLARVDGSWKVEKGVIFKSTARLKKAALKIYYVVHDVDIVDKLGRVTDNYL